MTYRITTEEENEIDSAFNDRDAARANARRLKTALDKAVAENARLREWILMTDNRLEVADCLQCVEVARSYLQAALADKQEGK